MVELARPTHSEAIHASTEAAHTPIDVTQAPAGVLGSGLSWGDIASGIWADQKKVWSDVLNGQMNAKEAGIALTEEGFGLMAAGPVVPIIGEAAIAAGAVVVVGGVAFMAAGNEMGE